MSTEATILSFEDVKKLYAEQVAVLSKLNNAINAQNPKDWMKLIQQGNTLPQDDSSQTLLPLLDFFKQAEDITKQKVTLNIAPGLVKIKETVLQEMKELENTLNLLHNPAQDGPLPDFYVTMGSETTASGDL
jgi:hypothetical protein